MEDLLTCGFVVVYAEERQRCVFSIHIWNFFYFLNLFLSLKTAWWIHILE